MANIRKRGDRWQAQVRLRGSLPVAKSFDRRADAEAWARQLETSIDGDPRLIEARTGRISGLTLTELLIRYRDHIVPRKRSRDQETSAINAFLRERLCQLPAAAITVEAIADYRDRRLLTLKPASVCRTLSIVQHAYETAIREWGLQIGGNPVKAVKRPQLANARVRRLSSDELASLTEGLKLSRNIYLKAAVELALETGMRRSELLRMTWEDIDRDRHAIYLPVTKNGHPRVLPLTAKARAILGGCSKDDAKVIPVSPNALRLAWDRLCKRSKVEDLHFHDLRAGFKRS